MHDLICGKLLGDGCLVKQTGRKPRFQFIHCKKYIGWSMHCYEQLFPFIPLNPPKYRRIDDGRITTGFTESYIVQSRTSEELCWLYEQWYPHGKKQLPFAYIQEHFNEKTLAWWYQDDGHFKHHNGIPRKIILSTDNFSVVENQFLIDLLQKKYSLLFSSDSQNRLVLYNQFQIIYFLRIVNPYIHESMNRKKRIPYDYKKIAERTTIYLPSDIIITKPTAEINRQYQKLQLLLDKTENFKEFFKHYISTQEQIQDVKAYQIKINAEFKGLLLQLKFQTGLNISQLTAYCFRL